MLDSPASTPNSRPELRSWRVLAGILLLATAAIHAYEVLGADVAFLIGGFIAAAAGTAAGAYLLFTRAPRLGWILGGLTALLTFIGYIVTRATPVPGDQDDFGNWLEPLGIASLVIEAILVGMAVWVLSGPHRVRGRHLVEEAKAVIPGLTEDGAQAPASSERPPQPARISIRQDGNPGTRQSRLCGLKQRERARGVAPSAVRLTPPVSISSATSAAASPMPSGRGCTNGLPVTS